MIPVSYGSGMTEYCIISYLYTHTGSCGGETDSCEVLTYDTDSLEVDSPNRLGEGSKFYVYSSLNVSAECSGHLRSVKFCYAYLREDEGGTNSAVREIVRVLLWRRKSRVVEAAIAITVNTTHCENPESGDRIETGRDYRLCCVYRPINPNLHLRAVQGSPLNFTLALKTPDSLGGIILHARETSDAVYGYNLVQHPYPTSVGSPVPHPSNCPAHSFKLGLISFTSKGSNLKPVDQQRFYFSAFSTT